MNTNKTRGPGTSIAAAGGFLMLLALPFQRLLDGFELGEFQQDQLGDIIRNTFIIIYAYAIIFRFGYKKLGGLGFRKPKNGYLMVIPFYFVILGIVLYAVFDYDFSKIEWTDTLILFIAMMFVGFSEEMVFRGFILPDLLQDYRGDKPQLIRLIVLASLMFGGLHFFNLFGSDVYIPAIISQVIYATMFGVAFGVFLLRTGQLWPLGILHGIINFTFNLPDLPGAYEPTIIDEYQWLDAILSVVIVIPLVIIALRQVSKIDQIPIE